VGDWKVQTYVKMNRKGQIVIPKIVRAFMKLGDGTVFRLEASSEDMTIKLKVEKPEEV